jgi:hypothetical protein
MVVGEGTYTEVILRENVMDCRMWNCGVVRNAMAIPWFRVWWGNKPCEDFTTCSFESLRWLLLARLVWVLLFLTNGAFLAQDVGSNPSRKYLVCDQSTHEWMELSDSAHIGTYLFFPLSLAHSSFVLDHPIGHPLWEVLGCLSFPFLF